MDGDNIAAIVVAVCGLAAAWLAYHRIAKARGWRKFCVMKRDRN